MNAASRKPAAAALDDDALLGLDNQLCFAVYSTSLAMTKLYKPVLDRLGLTYPQYLVMLVLWEQDGCSVGELGARLFLDSGTLTPLLKRLEAAGFITRTRSAEDERRVVIRLTRAGRALRAEARAMPAAMLDALQCPVGELSDLLKRLRALRARLGAHEDGDGA